MSTNHTTNYDLCQWEATDQVLRTDFNQDNAKIDAALNTLAGQVAEKAETADLTALAGTVAGHTAALEQAGNIQMYVTTYTGTGGFGEASPTALSFTIAPFLVVITGGQENAWGDMARKTGIMFQGGHLFVPLVRGGVCWPAAWAEDGKSVSWYAVNSDAAGQFNGAGIIYTVFSFVKTKD